MHLTFGYTLHCLKGTVIVYFTYLLPEQSSELQQGELHKSVHRKASRGRIDQSQRSWTFAELLCATVAGENARIARRGIQLSAKIQTGCGSYIRQRMEKGWGNFPSIISFLPTTYLLISNSYFCKAIELVREHIWLFVWINIFFSWTAWVIKTWMVPCCLKLSWPCF